MGDLLGENHHWKRVGDGKEMRRNLDTWLRIWEFRCFLISMRLGYIEAVRLNYYCH